MTNSLLKTQWPQLLRLALKAIETLPEGTSWTWGGGTALAMQLDHRLSYDIDIFFTDSTVLSRLSPTKNPIVKAITEKWQEPGHYIKLERPEGEIDFIVANLLTDPGFKVYDFEGSRIPMETVEEVLAKKLKFRGSQALARDVFDLAAARALAPESFKAAIDAIPEGASRLSDYIFRKKDRIRRELLSDDGVYTTETGEQFLNADLLELASVLRNP